MFLFNGCENAVRIFRFLCLWFKPYIFGLLSFLVYQKRWLCLQILCFRNKARTNYRGLSAKYKGVVATQFEQQSCRKVEESFRHYNTEYTQRSFGNEKSRRELPPLQQGVAAVQFQQRTPTAAFRQLSEQEHIESSSKKFVALHRRSNSLNKSIHT